MSIARSSLEACVAAGARLLIVWSEGGSERASEILQAMQHGVPPLLLRVQPWGCEPDQLTEMWIFPDVPVPVFQQRGDRTALCPSSETAAVIMIRGGHLSTLRFSFAVEQVLGPLSVFEEIRGVPIPSTKLREMFRRLMRLKLTLTDQQVEQLNQQWLNELTEYERAYFNFLRASGRSFASAQCRPASHLWFERRISVSGAGLKHGDPDSFLLDRCLYCGVFILVKVHWLAASGNYCPHVLDPHDFCFTPSLNVKVKVSESHTRNRQRSRTITRRNHNEMWNEIATYYYNLAQALPEAQRRYR